MDLHDVGTQGALVDTMLAPATGGTSIAVRPR